MGRTILAVLVLAVIGAAGYLVFFQGQGGDAPPPLTTDTPEPERPPAPDAGDREPVDDEPDQVGDTSPEPARDDVTAPAPVPEDEVGEPTKIMGTIRNELKKPIPGASVQLVKFNYRGPAVSDSGTVSIDRSWDEEVLAETTTDIDGRYEFADLVPGHRHYVRASAPEFLEQIKDSILVGKLVDFTLVRGSPVKGVVVDADTGDPIEGARVKGWYKTPKAETRIRKTFRWKKEVFTDEEGRFTFEAVPAFTVQFYLYSDRHEDKVEQLTVPQGELLDGVRFEMKRGLVIAGRVIDKLTAEPIPDVEVRMNKNALIMKHKVRTDDQGIFKVPGVERTMYIVMLQRKGYSPARLQRPFGDDDMFDSERENYIEVLMEPAGSAAGVVRDPEGNPVDNARVFVARRTPLNFQVRNVAEVVTDAEGKFLVTDLGTQSSYRIAAFREGGAIGVSEEFQVGPREVRENVDIVMPRGSAIRGRVVDEVGQPIPQVLVTLKVPPFAEVWFAGQPIGQQKTVTTLTDDDGRYELAGLWSGRYTCSLDHPEHVSLTDQQIQVKDDNMVIERDFTLKIGRFIAGQVTTIDGSSPEGASVKAYLGWSDQPAGQATADENGLYRIRGLVRGTYRVQARREGFTSKPLANVPHDSDNVNLQLTPSGSLTGSVQYQDGSPVEAFTLEMMRADLGALDPDVGEKTKAAPHMGGRTQTVRAPGGIFKVDDVDPGRYDVRISAPNGLPSLVSGAVVTPGDPPSDLGAIVLERGGSLSGRVTSAGTGVPLPNALVRLVHVGRTGGRDLEDEPGGDQDGAGPKARMDLNRSAWTARTDPDGFYDMKGLPPGPYRLSVSANNYVPADDETFTLARSEDKTVNVGLARGGTVVLELSDPYSAPVVSAVAQVYEVTPQRRRVNMRPPRSDARGRMTIDNLKPGSYVIAIRRSGFVSREVAVEVQAGRTTTQQVQLEKL